jgi:hypothetical protein
MGEIGKPNFENTPSNGQLEKGPTSNWAYDHAHDPDAHGNDLYPWTIFIDPFLPPKSHVNWNTIALDGAQIKYGSKDSGGNQNDEITWDLVLAAGTWSISILTVTLGSYGKCSVQFDSVEKATIDFWTGGLFYNAVVSASGIVVPTTKKIELKLKMAYKTGSGYLGRLTGIVLMRTA